MAKQYEKLLKGVLGEALGKGRLGPKYLESKVRLIWKKNMGPAIQGYTTEIKLYKQTVYITIVSAPLRAELNMGKDKILALFNEQLGHEHIKKIVIQ